MLSHTSASGRPAYVGMVKDSVSNSSSASEFNIQSEDFPALPGSNPNLHFGNNQHEGSSLSSASTVMSLGANNMTTGMGHHAGIGGSSGAGDANLKYKRGIQTSKDGRVTNIPPGMVTDQFGMVGLLTFIRAAESDQNLVSLALGTDLTTLGLNLNSNE
jgi:CCR4-NOT transcription complex subunit 2